MKSLHAFCVGLVIVIAPLVKAQEDSPPVQWFIRATFEQTEQALLEGLQSTNPDILSSVAITVRDLQRLYPERSYSSFVIPLMRIVKNESAEQNARVSAAITLHQLRSAMGDYAISRTAQFTDNERVKHICSWLTYYRQREKQQDATATVEKIPIQISLQPLEEVVD